MERYITLRNSFIALTAIVFLIAWNRGITLLYGMLAMLVAITVISFIAPYFMLRGVNAKQTAPEKLYEGDEFFVSVDVINQNKLSRYMIEIWDHFPGAAENEQNHMAFIPLLKKQFSSNLKYTCDRRGLHTLGPITLKSDFPMGVNHVQRTLNDSTTTTLVYPRAFLIEFFPYISGDYMPQVGVNAVALAGGSDVFFGVREYRHGDSPRHIHWPSSARHNELIVKEYEYITATEVTLLLDLHKEADHGEGKHSTLEYSVKIAASIARHALDQGHHVRLLGYGKACVHVSVSSGELHYQTILEALARVQADGDVPYRQAIENALSHVHESGVFVLFDVPAPKSKGQGDLSTFGNFHIKPVWVKLDTDSFLCPVQLKRGGAAWNNDSTPIYTVYNGDDLEKVFSLS
ncbi:MAG: DUF58 domain-containing protein [Gammaproteobacteria bacterium]|nr:DUF58 domain-containing protein [Gammaproteobacteria bacterium]